ncbi:LLM class flavin-dependent oxidoreductase [Aerococcaceae bacterium DSM 111176]|nr:LLM class flavin-dependent oxidoreductase [Aerococcaceae bacterium DSM 111176]
MSKIALSILNLISRFEDETELEAINRATELVKIVEELGYQRYWVAEHHNYRGTVGAANDLIIQRLLENSESIRVGAGGVMVPNHIPYQVAERFGTLDVMYPGRVDLGLGRAPGTDEKTAQILQKSKPTTENYEAVIAELQGYFQEEDDQGEIIAYPGVGRNVPLFVLGSSLSSAKTAAKLGLPYAFAGHMAPYYIDEAIELYREEFQPSRYLSEPHFILTILGIAAENKDEAQVIYQATLQQSTSSPNNEQNANTNYFNQLTSVQKSMIESKMGLKAIGDPSEIERQVEEINTKYRPDELMIVTPLASIEQLRVSFKIFADILDQK